MLKAPILPTLARMATPQALGFFVQSSVSIAEIWFIGQLGTTGLAAMALVFPLLMLIQMLSGGAFGGAVTGSVARALGAGLNERADRLLWNVIYLSLGLALILFLVYLFAGEAILRLLGGNADVLTEAYAYISLLFPFSVLIWLSNMLLGVVRGSGNMKLPALLQIGGSLIQVPLSGCLILGLGPFPSMGITGAAISILVMSFINVSILIYLFTHDGSPVQLRRSTSGVNLELLADILSVGALAAVSPFFTVFTILVMTGLVGQFGVTALAGYGIAARIEFLVIPLVFGLGVSMNAMVGSCIGAKDFDRAEKIGWTGSITAGLITGMAGILLAIFPEFWVMVFSDDVQTIAVAADYFQITAPFFGFLGMGLSLYFASQGARAVGWPVAVTVLRFIVGIGGGWILIQYFDGGVSELFMCISAGMLVYWLGTAGALYFGTWRKEEIL